MVHVGGAALCVCGLPLKSDRHTAALGTVPAPILSSQSLKGHRYPHKCQALSYLLEATGSMG